VRIVLRLLCVVVIASAAITVWTRAALGFVLGPQVTAVCLWIAAGGSLCAVITLAWTTKPGSRRRHRPPEPSAGYIVRGDRDRASAVMTGQETGRSARNQARRATYAPGGDGLG
jgi:membrane protein implicated in regulation of membrane protease activity